MPIGAAPAAESYLVVSRILDAARRAGADAVHPGYGFLAENAGFAAACEEAGLIFVGPPAAVIAQMGSKIEARARALEAGLPVVPGATPDGAGRRVAARGGRPRRLPAAREGVGRRRRQGHARRRATRPSLAEACASARHEAGAAFGDATLYLERLIERPRHVEVQVLGDAHGHVVHLFERDCSIQRRHQKIVEETPVAVDRRRACGGRWARRPRRSRATSATGTPGTVEFLVEGRGEDARFYFLEMNTRLQVEHPVTEAVAGVDLVHAQLRVASGEPLPWTQERLDAARPRDRMPDLRGGPRRSDFLPQAGPLAALPRAAGARASAWTAAWPRATRSASTTTRCSPSWSAWAETREAARRRLVAALRQFAVLGIRTNVPFLIRVLEHPRFGDGGIDTSFLDEEGRTLREPSAGPGLSAALAAAAAYEPDGHRRHGGHGRPIPGNGCRGGGTRRLKAQGSGLRPAGAREPGVDRVRRRSVRREA